MTVALAEQERKFTRLDSPFPRFAVLRAQMFSFLVQNPFYELEMPIRCELFTSYLEDLIERHSSAGAPGSKKPSAQH